MRDVEHATDALISGLTAGAAFGLLMQFVLGVMATVGGLYTGQPSVAVGWVVHLAHSMIAALIYGYVVDNVSYVEGVRGSLLEGLGAGAAFGAVLWLLGASIAMPLWTNALGLTALSVPNFGLQRLVGHIVYGGLLGLLYSWLAS
jgi:uncharacterized membrane protein YagU involved in acid resistance